MLLLLSVIHESKISSRFRPCIFLPLTPSDSLAFEPITSLQADPCCIRLTAISEAFVGEDASSILSFLSSVNHRISPPQSFSEYLWSHTPRFLSSCPLYIHPLNSNYWTLFFSSLVFSFLFFLRSGVVFVLLFACICFLFFSFLFPMLHSYNGSRSVVFLSFGMALVLITITVWQAGDVTCCVARLSLLDNCAIIAYISRDCNLRFGFLYLWICFKDSFCVRWLSVFGSEFWQMPIISALLHWALQHWHDLTFTSLVLFSCVDWFVLVL